MVKDFIINRITPNRHGTSEALESSLSDSSSLIALRDSSCPGVKVNIPILTNRGYIGIMEKKMETTIL